MEKQTNIAVIGLGGVGGYFGGIIAHQISKSKNNEFQIHFVAHGDHFQAIKQNNLTIKMANQSNLVCVPTSIASDIKDVPQPDIIIIAVKSFDLDTVINHISDSIKPDTIILPLLNGVDIYDKIRSKIKEGIILPACAYSGSSIESPGVIIQNGKLGHIVIGKDPLHKNYMPDSLLNLFKSLEISHQFVDDATAEIWEKYIFIASYGLVTACFNKTIGEVYRDYDLKETARAIMHEIYNIGIAKGIKLYDVVVEDSLNKGRVFPYDSKTSLQIDVETKGKLNESDLFGETIIRLSHQTGIPTPVTNEIYQRLLKKEAIVQSIAR